jgi:hypothetical protein
MALEDIAGPALVAIGELVGSLINPTLRSMGFTEVKAEQIANAIIFSILAFLVLGLFYITFKYS